MIDASPLKQRIGDRPVAIYGMGKSAYAAIASFVAAGIDVYAGDDNPDRLEYAVQLGAKILAGGLSMRDCAFVMLAPGVPLTHPAPHKIVSAARDAGVEIVSDIELLHRLGHGRKTIAITGTNGKSTTTALIGHILSNAGIDTQVGGNIGVAVFDLDMPRVDGCFVLEMSSFQIDLGRTFHPDIAVHLNITPDHLDRHGTIENYAAVKRRLFDGAGCAVIGMDDDYSKNIADDIKRVGTRNVYGISVTHDVRRGAYVDRENNLHFADGDMNRIVCNASGFKTLSGRHNYQNLCAAYMVCHLYGVSDDDIMRGVATFPGLNHRQYIVREIAGVPYINDSKATNADATSMALKSYRDIYWIVGGKPKDGGLSGLESYIDRIKHAYLIGVSSDEFAAWMDKNNVSYTRCETMENAVMAAHNDAKSGVVLLSPACASYDQYSGFEARGDDFANRVLALEEAAT